jgi:hypothetical protein
VGQAAYNYTRSLAVLADLPALLLRVVLAALLVF